MIFLSKNDRISGTWNSLISFLKAEGRLTDLGGENQ